MGKSTCMREGCTSRIIRIIGDCNYCSSKFCGDHRLPEDHLCKNIQDVKKKAFSINETNVLNGRCVGQKLDSF